MDKNSEAMRALLSGRYADADAAFAAIEAAGADKAQFKATADQGEYILILLEKPAKAESKADAAPAKGKAKGKGKAQAAPDAKAKKGLAKRIAAQGDLKAKPAKAKADPGKDYGNSWRPLSARKWIGPWADYRAKAEKGMLPDVGGAKLDRSQQRLQKFYGLNDKGFSIFAADTHKPFEKRLMALCALIRARDVKGLKAHEIKEVSTTPMMLAKLRDLAIAALSAKAEKANGKKAKADPAPADQPQAPADQPQG